MGAAAILLSVCILKVLRPQFHAVAALAGMGGTLLLYYVVIRVIGTWLYSGKSEWLQEISLAATPTLLHERTVARESWYLWDTFQIILEGPQSIHLRSGNNLIAIPRQAFASEQEWREFLALAHGQRR